MTYPVKPATAYSFTDYQAASPTDPLPGNELDADLAEHKASIDAVIDFIQTALRSDGNLTNGIVRPESLSAATLALMGTTVSFEGAWLTATAYAVNDIVTESNKTYICIVAHTSGTFATDMAAGKWQLLEGDNASLAGVNVWTGTQEFDAAVNFDGAVDFSAAETHSGAVTFSGATAVPTATAGDNDTTAASTAFVQAAVGKVYIQKFTSVPTAVTVTVASPAVMSWASHGLAIGQAFQVATTGTLPAGMALTTTYFIISAGFEANSFQFSLTRGGAAINTTGTGSGTHTATPFYVPSTGMVKAWGETLGGGGAGGSTATASASARSTAAGGGAGSRSFKMIAAADVAAAGVAVTIGAAGAAAAAGANNGGNGGDTSIGALCIGKGGTGGTAGNNTFSAGGAGGVAGTGDVTATGQAGDAGGTQSNSFVVPMGKGGSSPHGSGGLEVASGQSNGNAATGYGSGGSGGISTNAGGTQAGGAGTPGLAVIIEFCNQ